MIWGVPWAGRAAAKPLGGQGTWYTMENLYLSIANLNPLSSVDFCECYGEAPGIIG